jgi:hypothetical protein
MDKICKKKYDLYLGFLKMAQGFLGISDWKITLDKEVQDLGPNFARIHFDPIEKEGEVQVSFTFLDKPDNKKLNILLHEIVHLRVACLNKNVEDYRENEEEEMVNDIVRGFESVTKDFSFSGFRASPKSKKAKATKKRKI